MLETHPYPYPYPRSTMTPQEEMQVTEGTMGMETGMGMGMELHLEELFQSSASVLAALHAARQNQDRKDESNVDDNYDATDHQKELRSRLTSLLSSYRSQWPALRAWIEDWLSRHHTLSRSLHSHSLRSQQALRSIAYGLHHTRHGIRNEVKALKDEEREASLKCQRVRQARQALGHVRRIRQELSRVEQVLDTKDETVPASAVSSFHHVGLRDMVTSLTNAASSLHALMDLDEHGMSDAVFFNRDLTSFRRVRDRCVERWMKKLQGMVQVETQRVSASPTDQHDKAGPAAPPFPHILSISIHSDPSLPFHELFSSLHLLAASGDVSRLLSRLIERDIFHPLVSIACEMDGREEREKEEEHQNQNKDASSNRQRQRQRATRREYDVNPLDSDGRRYLAASTHDTRLHF